MKLNIATRIKAASDQLSNWFNSLSYRVHRSVVLVVGLSAALICSMVTLGQLLPGKEVWIQPEPLTRPIDIQWDTTETKMQTPAAPHSK